MGVQYKNIDELEEETVITGEEKVPVSSTSFVLFNAIKDWILGSILIVNRVVSYIQNITISMRLQVNPGTASGNYNEGIRIANASNGYSLIGLGCDAATNSGLNTDGKQWFLIKYPNGECGIVPNSSTISLGLRMVNGGEIYWRNAAIPTDMVYGNITTVVAYSSVISLMNTHAANIYYFKIAPTANYTINLTTLTNLISDREYSLILLIVGNANGYTLTISDSRTNRNTQVMSGEALFSVKFRKIGTSVIFTYITSI